MENKYPIRTSVTEIRPKASISVVRPKVTPSAINPRVSMNRHRVIVSPVVVTPITVV